MNSIVFNLYSLERRRLEVCLRFYVNGIDEVFNWKGNGAGKIVLNFHC